MRKTLLILIAVFIFCEANVAQSSIQSVDFNNFTYSAYCAGELAEKITVRSGEYSKETQQDGYVDRIWFKIFSIKYGDLNGDGKDEAVILSVCNTGGTGNFTEGFIYGLAAGHPQLLARIPGGDRAYGGLREATIDRGLLSVESNDPGENGASCCPEFIQTQKYRLVGKKLTVIGKPTKKPIVDTERLTFAKGASSKTISIILPAGESKRFVVGARSGQRLSASATSEKILISLISMIEENLSNNLSVVLDKNGDQTIELTNSSESQVDFSLRVSIEDQ
jgi:hypothetical protein